ncbi:type II toxin-antitoxin system prevent-host-death family antitoxin [Streptomyces ossamyceticus]|uniref:type II toxin-antitoxin system prevent-host-death family antitoxin n=1 Tax=Streptomyces ossamyceticus TaxID=249581 RepID=UPI0034449658
MAHFAANTPTALYRLYDAAERLLYVGISTQPETRWTQHAADKPWWSLVRRRTVEWHPDREAAEKAERSAVQAEEPLYNTAGARTSLVAAHFPIADTLTQSQARLRISDLLDATQFGGRDVAITRRGKVAGVVMSPENYDAAVEALAMGLLTHDEVYGTNEEKTA